MINPGGNCQRVHPIPPPSGFSAKNEEQVMYKGFENFELEKKYLSIDEIELLEKIRI